MKDFLENELNVGQQVIFIHTIRSGSSSHRTVLNKGKIVRLTLKMVEILDDKYGDKFLIVPEKVVVI